MHDVCPQTQPFAPPLPHSPGPQENITAQKKSFHLRNSPRPPRHGLLAALTAPDPHRVTLDGRFAAESAGVAGVLADFHLFDLFAEGGAVSGLRTRVR